MKITGIILAGGKSERMGIDKALLTIGPVTFLEHLTSLLNTICNEVIVVGNDRGIENIDAQFIDDLVPNKGPLMGLLSGLKHSSTETNLVLSIDSPLVMQNDVKSLIKEHKSICDITLYKTQKLNPFPGIYNKQIMGSIESQLKENNFRLTDLILKNRHKIITPNKEIASNLANVNTQEEYKKLFKNEIGN